MVTEMIIALIAGAGIGSGGMYVIQRRNRMQELKRIEKLAGDILNGERLRAAAKQDSNYKDSKP